MRLSLILAATLLPLAWAHAAETEHREHGAHAHGHGMFNVAIEGKTLAMELVAPGADIVGFEHKAESKTDKEALAAARKTLSDVAKVVALPAGAGCTLETASVELEAEDEHDDHDTKKTNGDKKEHSEFHAEYQLTCSSPEKLTGMTFVYFDTFMAAEELDVTVIGPKQQLKFEVNRETTKIALGGIM